MWQEGLTRERAVREDEMKMRSGDSEIATPWDFRQILGGDVAGI